MLLGFILSENVSNFDLTFLGRYFHQSQKYPACYLLGPKFNIMLI